MHTNTIFTLSLRQKQTPEFIVTLKKELATLKSGVLPIQSAVTQGGYANDSNLSCTILSSKETTNSIVIKLGVFFIEIV